MITTEEIGMNGNPTAMALTAETSRSMHASGYYGEEAHQVHRERLPHSEHPR